ncbi:outer membrane protein [Bradyrhizobium sp. CCGUVB23]|uniref:outer membrane protein n=1 Tax=Bradyrhizobium sp. CCGUVB23 TaxID=2949630 RepID=UPI0020B3389B|nr:porin family protein [Bradyrhizobium sp. CCGUVB23]MCP3466355.1 porin family protein [Bradyrhizobium sp. CCGUVB23]
MKKIVLALTAVAAMTGAASAADLAARPYTKAPVAVAPVPSWTGCYIAAGGGGAMTNNDHNTFLTATGAAVDQNTTSGARGWLATVQGGCDYQFAGNWLVGAFADYDFMDVRGDINVPAVGPFTGSQKQDWQWAVGARVGYLVLPQLLTYVSGGYTQAHWKDTDLSFPLGGIGATFTVPGGTKGGWFIGTGDEYALTSFLPGLFWKTEYRYSEFDRVNVPLNVAAAAGGGTTAGSVTEKFREHSVRSELVYRFNWAGPVVAKY